MDAAFTFHHVAIADPMGRRANIEIGGKPEENGAIVANGKSAEIFTTNANGVGDMSTVTIDGDR